MRLFVWDDVDALAPAAIPGEDSPSGYALALALTKEQAIELIFAAETQERRYALKLELHDKEPKIFDGPIGFAIEGSSLTTHFLPSPESR